MKIINIDNILPLLDMKVGDRIETFKTDSSYKIVKIESIERYENYDIIFNGEYYFLIRKGGIIAQSRNREDVIPVGVAKVI